MKSQPWLLFFLGGIGLQRGGVDEILPGGQLAITDEAVVAGQRKNSRG
jgi:hypothetical protein